MRKIMMFLVLSIAIYMGYGMVAMEASTAWNHQQVVVHRGDTLWAIANRWTEDGEDIRVVVQRICEANNIANNSYLLPGQRLLVPIRANTEYLAQR